MKVKFVTSQIRAGPQDNVLNDKFFWNFRRRICICVQIQDIQIPGYSVR
jgi:hypothetical protein